MKKFKKKAEDLINLVDMSQRCIATDKITCEGSKIGLKDYNTKIDIRDIKQKNESLLVAT